MRGDQSVFAPWTITITKLLLLRCLIFIFSENVLTRTAQIMGDGDGDGRGEEDMGVKWASYLN